MGIPPSRPKKGELPMGICRLIASLLCGTVVAAVAVSSAASQDAKPEPDGGYTVGFVAPMIQLPFYAAMKCSAEKTAKKNNINLLWQGSTTSSPRDMMQIVQALVAQNPDGMLLAPWDATAFIASTKEMMSAGIPVITVDGSLNEPVDVANIRTGNIAAGKQAAEDLMKIVGGKGTVLILTDSPGNKVQTERYSGFKEVLESKFKGVTVLPVQYVNSQAAKASTITSATIAANPDLVAIYTTQDAGGEGAANALRAAGKTGEIKLVGFDATPAQVENLKAGNYDALVSQAPYDIGEQMIVAMKKVLVEGAAKAALPRDTLTGFKTLTRENVDLPESRRYIFRSDCADL
ncbi:ABC transporter substrate-binding protein [Agrobacterium leguminum]|uniref:ABC transporter substrate-binding protein n=1 Tax=Agrobacterium leguminum TaxID=2792015 RepID=UPI0022B84305|nr:ABC transporter substrate-binding protein [Agrobacterium leguminum]MCZ7934866.1 ABC transporter substrate-binding protein [Agrobacterium leguminum]MCZ7977001.1 ABC transporter substrate-binding protein [Agrobacterium salinitolerans]